MKHNIYLFLIFVFFQANLSAQSEIVKLWPDKIPGAVSGNNYQEIPVMQNGRLKSTSKVTNPTLAVFIPEKPNGTAVVILPGGGYRHLAVEKEGYKVAEFFNSIGVSAFVLKYRLPGDEIMENKSIGPLQDAQEAMRFVRRNVEKWKLDSNKVGIMGFSAGGHLAASLSTQFEKKVYTPADAISARPDFSILIYPVISMEDGITHNGSRENLLGKLPAASLVEEYSTEKQIDSTTPPAFLIHATDDKAVPVENSINYYLALKENSVPAEMHIYEKGGHGFGLGREGTNQYWPEALEKWLISNQLVEEDHALLFSYFKGNGEDGLHLAYSEDAYTWKALKNDTSFLTPKLGKEKLMRDPCIIKGGDGKYHMVWTVGWTAQGIGYATSDDLINWSPQQFIPVMEHEPNARNTWAPEITYDPDSGIYMIYWASTITGKFPETQSQAEDAYNHRMYYTTTKDFSSFTPTSLLYEPGFNVIDANIVKKGDRFIMFLKDETREPAQKNIKIAYSNSLTGPYTQASDPITGDYWAEGPTALEVDGKWLVYFDKYIEKEYGAVESSDLQNWKDVSHLINFPEGARHGSVIKIPDEALKKLQKAE